MKTSHSTPRLSPAENRSELLILPDGTILAHNLTPALAQVLQTLSPQDETLKLRAASAPPPERSEWLSEQQRPMALPPGALCPPLPIENQKSKF